jgi:hypothetical protein
METNKTTNGGRNSKKGADLLRGSKPLRFKLIATEAMNYPITILSLY